MAGMQLDPGHAGANGEAGRVGKGMLYLVQLGHGRGTAIDLARLVET